MSEEATIVNKQEHTEVVGLDGQNVSPGGLDTIFSAIESAKNQGKTAEDAINSIKAKQGSDEKEGQTSEPEKKDETASPEAGGKGGTAETPESGKETPPKGEENKAVKPEQKKEEEVPEDELQPLPHDKPKTVQRIKALLKKIETVSSEATKTKTERDEKAAKLAELEQKLSQVQTANPETEKKVKEQLDELAMYRRRYELDKDPEVKTRFDDRVQAAEETIVNNLKKARAGDALIKIIEEEGGWQGFSNSDRIIPIPDGEGGTKRVSASELADLILNELPLGTRKTIEAAMLEQVQTKRDKERFFKEEQAKANDYFKTREQEAQKASEAQRKQLEEAAKAIDEWKKKVESSDWLKDKEIPANASAQEKASIEEYNRSNTQIREYLAKALEAKDMDSALGVVQDAARYYDERRTTAALRDEVKKLKDALAAKEAEFAKFKSAGRSVPKAGSIAAPAPSSEGKGDVGETLEETLNRIQRGEIPVRGRSVVVEE